MVRPAGTPSRSAIYFGPDDYIVVAGTQPEVVGLLQTGGGPINHGEDSDLGKKDQQPFPPNRDFKGP